MEPKPRVALFKLTETQQKSGGGTVFSGSLGESRLVMVRDRDFVPNPDKPQVISQWVVYAEKADRARPPSKDAPAKSPAPASKAPAAPVKDKKPGSLFRK